MAEHQDGRMLEEVYLNNHATYSMILKLINRLNKNLQVITLNLHMNHIDQMLKNFYTTEMKGKQQKHGKLSKGPWND